MFPLRSFRFLAACLLVLGLGAALLPSSPALAGPGGAWIGVRLQELSDDLRSAMDIDRHVQGALVSDVLDDSPAEKAGLADGDVIVEVAGRRTVDLEAVTAAVRELEPGEKALIVIHRDGQSRGLDIVPLDREKRLQWVEQESGGDRKMRRLEILKEGEKRDQARKLRFLRQAQEQGGFLGVQSMELGQLAGYFGVAKGEGVLVTEVVGDGPAEEAGLQAGDVILALGDEAVGDPEDLRKAVRGREPGEAVAVRILRRGERSTVTVKLGEASDMGDAEMFFLGPDDVHVTIPEIPPIPRLPRVDVDGPIIGWRGDKDAYLLHLDEEELEKFKEELHKNLEEMREQLDEMKRELRKLHEDTD